MLEFNTNHNPPYGVCEEIAPKIKRVTAKNPSKFTFKGTGTYIIGNESVAVIDPGPDNKEHIDALIKALDGKEVSHILITHTHRDHSPASRALQEKVGGLICGFGAHPVEISEKAPESKKETDPDKLEESGDLEFKPDKFLSHNEILAGRGWTVECIYTPGHISNHLCFAFPEASAVFTGDHIMGWSTSIIPPPNGRLDDYMDSLSLLLEREEKRYFPTHGAPIDEPKKYVEALIQHRENRSMQILKCLDAGSKTIEEIVKIIYADHPKELHKPAEKSVLAHLIYLNQKGVVFSDGPINSESMFSV